MREGITDEQNYSQTPCTHNGRSFVSFMRKHSIRVFIIIEQEANYSSDRARTKLNIELIGLPLGSNVYARLAARWNLTHVRSS